MRAYAKYLEDYDKESNVFVDGLLVEPLNPSYAVTRNKYFMTKKLRNKLLGKIQNHEFLNKTNIAVLDEYLRKKLSSMRA